MIDILRVLALVVKHPVIVVYCVTHLTETVRYIHFMAIFFFFSTTREMLRRHVGYRKITILERR